MSDAKCPDLEARRRAEVERAVAPYKGKVPDFMLAKLYELAERYWTENPVAARVLQLQEDKLRARSGTEARGAAEEGETQAAVAGEKKKV